MVQEQIVSSEKTNKNEGNHRDEPELRFNYSESWKELKLKDLLEPKSSNLSINDLEDNFGDFPLYGASGFIKNIDFYQMDSDYISIVKDGSGVGKLSFYESKSSIVGTSQYLLPKKGFDIHFLYYALQTLKFEKYINGSSIPHIYFKDYKIEKLRVPNKEEQEKIGTFLKTIDDKIELLEKKYENKKMIKNYYLNIILIENFQNNPQWDYKPLNEITFYQEGPGVRNYQYVSEGIKLLNVGNFVENQLILDTTDRYISEEEAYGMYKHFLVDEGDLLIACSGIKAEYFDEKIAFAEKNHLPLCMNTSTMRFKSLNEDYLNLNYLKWYFQTTLFKKQIFRVLTGSAQFNFGPTHLKYLKIIVPPIEYQLKISRFFDLLKKDLDYTKKQIEEMKNFKKALLQKMFI